MITSIKQAKMLAAEYNKIKKDIKRLAFLKEHKKDFWIQLDNDHSMVCFKFSDDFDEDERMSIEDSVELKSFDDYHGWGDGVVTLFEFVGITAEPC